MKTLKGAAGNQGASFGTRLFKAEPDGTVMVPDIAVPSLVGVGGFEVVEMPDGHVKMHSLAGAQTVSVAGQVFETGEGDMIFVPMDLADELLSHNFEYVSVEAEETAGAPVSSEENDTLPALSLTPPVAEPVVAEPPTEAPVVADTTTETKTTTE